MFHVSGESDVELIHILGLLTLYMALLCPPFASYMTHQIREKQVNFQFALFALFISHSLAQKVIRKSLHKHGNGGNNLLSLHMATSHTSQEPWPCICESPKESVQRLPQDTFKNTQCGHGPSSVVWSHTWLHPQSNAISINFYSCRVLTHNKIEWIKRFWDFGVPWSHGFVLGLPPRGGFKK